MLINAAPHLLEESHFIGKCDYTHERREKRLPKQP